MPIPKLEYTPKKPWRAIAAMSKNRVIGQGNTIPWHYSEDFKYFKQQTLGASMLMGSKTYASIGRPLPKRTTIVLSRQPKPNDIPEKVVWINALAELDTLDLPEPLWLCGGAQIYSAALHQCEDLLLTIIDIECAGDAFFPEFNDLFPQQEIVGKSDGLTWYRFYR